VDEANSAVDPILGQILIKVLGVAMYQWVDRVKQVM
jgi:hypothetical protein